MYDAEKVVSISTILAISFDLTFPLSIKMYNAEKMCEVTSFCCGCADLRKGALIIGSLNLVKSIIIAIIIIIINNMMTIIIHKQQGHHGWSNSGEHFDNHLD